MTPAQALLAFVLFQRLAELWLSRRNTERLLARGAVEHGASHYPFLVLLHGSWLAALVLTVPAETAVDGFWLAIFVLLQLGRLWVLTTLGARWTTRIITLAGAPLVREGPYRFLRHPNYAVVAGEIAVVPLALDAWTIAAVFSVLNAGLLYERIRVENAALGARK